jgi:hypothetical protein
MANKKITDLTDIGTPANDDLLEIVDVSDLTDSPEGTSKKVLVSALGGGSTPTLQDVRDIDPNVTVENPNDANNVGLWNSLQYNEDALKVEDRLLIETLSGDVQYVTSRFSDSATIQIQGSIYDSVTEDSLQSTLAVEQGKAIILEIINDSTLNQGSHKIELDPAIGEEVIFKTPNDATTGTETIATREWVDENKINKNNVRQILFSKWNGNFGIVHTGDTLETVIHSINIAANDFQAGDNLSVLLQFKKDAVGGGTIVWRLRAGTNGTTADDQIATMTQATGATVLDAGMTRERFEFKTGNILEGYRSNTNSPTDILSSGLSRTQVTINPSNAWKLTITAQLQNNTDSASLTGYIIGKTKTL